MAALMHRVGLGWVNGLRSQNLVRIDWAMGIRRYSHLGVTWRWSGLLNGEERVISWQGPQVEDCVTGINWSWAVPMAPIESELPWEGSLTLDQNRWMNWQWGTLVDQGRKVGWQLAVKHDWQGWLAWRQGVGDDVGFNTAWQQAQQQDGGKGLGWERAAAFARDLVVLWQKREQGAKVSLVWFSFVVIGSDWHLRWCFKRGTVVYMPTLTLTKVSTSQTIPLTAAKVSIDLNSWSWAFSADLATSVGMGLVRPVAGPVEVELEINGYYWRVLVERVSVSRAFGAGSWRISGRSSSCQLAEPYAPLQTRRWDQEILARQIVGSELADTGWSEDWRILDWTIPAGVFAVTDCSSMDICLTVAKACGAVVQTHPNEKKLIFQYLYPVTPRDYGVSPLAATLDDATLLRQEEEWQARPGYDGVVVSGRDQGVLVYCKRTDTPATMLAPQQVNPLVTSMGVGRELGRSILDGLGYDASVYSRVSALAPAPGSPSLRLPGDLVEVEEPGERWRGLITSVEIAATVGSEGGVSVLQTFSIERPHLALLPKRPLRIGTVQSHNVDGTSTLVDASNREFIAQGQGVAINSKAFVQDDRVIGEAPDLPVYTEFI
ncbi:MAG: hypothetical protein H7832_13015 [Magnetococcus sp. DMHC-6]